MAEPEVVWTPDTMIGDMNSVRIEARQNCTSTTFLLFLAKFITAHKDRIIQIREVGKTIHCPYTCFIILKGMDPVTFENQMGIPSTYVTPTKN